MSSPNVYESGDATFDEDVLQSPTPVMVEFWAPWCGPCRALAPTLDRIADKYTGRLVVVKVNVDQNSRSAKRYHALSIPRMVVFKGGREVAALLGAHPQPRIEAMLAPHLGPESGTGGGGGAGFSTVPEPAYEQTPMQTMPPMGDYAPSVNVPPPSVDEPGPLDDLIQPAGRRR